MAHWDGGLLAFGHEKEEQAVFLMPFNDLKSTLASSIKSRVKKLKKIRENCMPNRVVDALY